MADKKEKSWLGTRTKNEQRPNENYEQAENKELIERTKKAYNKFPCCMRCARSFQ